ncbi:helix-turn-helix domain-containing protein [Bradyrhizobium sp. ORS 86]|uniref:helix-turn-helix domain-containing protein n=1 Tax=Bradyrhizobium sp. ORS 86 TaxID=1685970 RepID=UPI003890F908
MQSSGRPPALGKCSLTRRATQAHSSYIPKLREISLAQAGRADCGTGGLAESERSLIPARTGEGRARAKADRVKFGRKPKLTPLQTTEAKHRLAEGETQTDVARLFGVSHQTIGRL